MVQNQNKDFINRNCFRKFYFISRISRILFFFNELQEYAITTTSDQGSTNCWHVGTACRESGGRKRKWKEMEREKERE